MKKTLWAQLILMLGIVALFVGEGFSFGVPSVAPHRLQTRFSGLTSPIFMTHAGDGSKRIFIVERPGIIKVVQPGSNTPTVFLNITSLTSTDGERGLLSLAFHPQFKENRRFFVYYTRVSDGAIQISEFKASASDPNVADPTVKEILTVPHPTYSNHNGGTIAFGPDGYLYAGTGDGGSGNDPANNAQNINVLLGKFLRIDVDTTGRETEPYMIPSDNPYAGSIPGADEIYAVGMRNPFRWSFDRGGDRQLWAADVGQNAWEEVSVIVRGGNYGWRIYEGNQCTGLEPVLCNPVNFVPPVFEYHSMNTTSRCSITGGYVYRGTQGALPTGSYIYGDYCTGEVLLWHNGQQMPLFDVPDFNLSAFGEDEDGELYVVQMGNGIIRKIVPGKASADFDGGRRTDLSVFRPINGTWYILNGSTGAVRVQQFGVNGDTPTAEDYDGDGKTDISVFRPSNNSWYSLRTADSTFRIIEFGEEGDMPVPADYNGDGKAEIAVFRPSNGNWYFLSSIDSSFSIMQWGQEGDIPVSGDYDGDGKSDIAVWRPSNGFWYSINSSNGSFLVNGYGQAGDIPATGDFDGDGRNDLAVFRESTGLWYLKRSSNNSFTTVSWGQTGDIPVVGDYDNDGRDDIAVYRGSTGSWYIIGSTSGMFQVNGWGVSGDIPIPSIDNP